MSYAQAIRNYAKNEYIDPARRRGETEVRIRAGDVHKAMKFANRPALVCQALRSNIFRRENNLVLIKDEGPPSGLSTSVVFTYRVAESGVPTQPTSADPAASENPSTRFLGLLQLKGIGKELFASLGGGENFIRSERKAFADAIEKQDRERGLL